MTHHILYRLVEIGSGLRCCKQEEVISEVVVEPEV